MPGVSSLILGMAPGEPSVQFAGRTDASAADGASGSNTENSHPLTVKMEQELASLLTTSQNSVGEDSPIPSRTDSNQVAQSSQTTGSVNDFMSMLSKKAAENPATKENLLKLLSSSPNSSVNKNSSEEVEKILSDLSASQIPGRISNANVLQNQKFEAGVRQVANGNTLAQDLSGKSLSGQVSSLSEGKDSISASISQPTVNLPRQADKTSTLRGNQSNTKTGNTSPVPADSNALTQDLSGKILSARGFSSLSEDKDSTKASMLQSAENSSKQSDKISTVRGNQTNAKSENPSPVTDKITGKLSAATEKESSSKPDSGFADLIKNDATNTSQTISINSKVESQFKHDLSDAVDSSRDTTFSKPDVSEVAQTIIREAKMMMQANKTVLNVKLEPESLGSVVLRVSSDNGKVSAEFNVKTTDVRTYLESSIPQMKQVLESNGVSLSQLSVTLSGGESQTKQRQYNTRKNSQKFSTETISEPTDSVRNFGYNTMEVKI